MESIPKERKSWFRERVLEGENPEELLARAGEFYTQEEKAVLKRWVRMLPVLEKIYKRKKEIELSEKQKRLMGRAGPA